MNIHHLELFYYVAKHGGISEAVRNMPYGIQQPAMSGQIIQLEESLGVTLFQRRPFALTGQGEELFAFIAPFFENLRPVAEKIRGGVSQHIRIGASEIVLRDHLPGIVQTMQAGFPKLKVTLREGYQPELESCICKKELDLALTVLSSKPPSGTQSLPLFDLPLVLLVPRNSRLKSCADLWARKKINETLISLPANEAICKSFQDGLRRIGVEWVPDIEVSTIDLVQTYVANGHGIGLSIVIPHVKFKRVRALPLEGFAPVTFGIFWQGKTTPLLQALLNRIQQAAQVLTGTPTRSGRSVLPIVG
jgi:DNA-binding transcriptional LysR family regulator